MNAIRHTIVRAALLILLLFGGCATKSTIETRRVEKLHIYDTLPADQKTMVDAGQIRIGMPADAVYIAWGKPSEVLESEDANGRFTTWRYYGSTLQEHRYWAYREVNHGRRGGAYLERYLTSDYTSRDYVRSEIVFQNGTVISWRTLPRPTE